MNFSLVALSLLVIVGIDECWGSTPKEMTAASKHFSTAMGAMDQVIRNKLNKPSQRKITYDNYVEGYIEKGEPTFANATKTSLQACVNALKESSYPTTVTQALNTLCQGMKNDPQPGTVIYGDFIKAQYGKIAGGEANYNSYC